MHFYRPLEKQRGAVLIVSLIMLSVMTLFVISMLRTSILELKIGGSHHTQALNFANAEFAINKWINDNNGRIAPNFLGLTPSGGAGSGCTNATPGAGQCNDPPSVSFGSVTITPTQIHCGPWTNFGSMMGASQLVAARFDLRGFATGTLGGTTIVHQGVQSLAPPGTC